MGSKSYSKGISWIDDCRIPFVDEGDKSIGIITKQKQNIFGNGDGFIRGEYQLNTQGRFPANLLVSDDMLNDGVISKSNDNIRNNRIEQKIYGGGKGIPPQSTNGFNDKGTNSRYYDIDKWFDNLIDV
jgi:hypothetical protein